MAYSPAEALPAQSDRGIGRCAFTTVSNNHALFHGVQRVMFKTDLMVFAEIASH